MVNREWLGQLRQFRFGSTVCSTSTSSYKCFDAWCPLLTAWFQTSTGKAALLNFSKCIDACVNGILIEAAQYHRTTLVQAEYIVSKIRQQANNSKKAVSELCVHFYTTNSFLYDILNRALRDEDLSKVDTLGPICYLIRNHCRYSKPFSGQTYRGIQLSEEEIIAHKNAIGLWKRPAYTSTSRERNIAEAFGNTLFIINLTLTGPSCARAIDISSISQYEDEQEVITDPCGYDIPNFKC